MPRCLGQPQQDGRQEAPLPGQVGRAERPSETVCALEDSRAISDAARCGRVECQVVAPNRHCQRRTFGVKLASMPS